MLRLARPYSKEIHAIALPMMLSAISLPLLGMVDTAILGHLESEKYLAAINIGNMAVNMLLWGLSFFRMSTTGLVAQSFGLGQQRQTAEHLARAFYLVMILAVLLLLSMPLLISLQLLLLANGGEVENLAQDYLQVRYFSLPAALSLFVINGYLLATNQARKVLYLTLICQLSNMILDYVLVFHFHLGVVGVAWGSLIAELLACTTGLYWLWKAQALTAINNLHALLKQQRPWLNFFQLNFDIFIRTVCLIVVFSYLTKQSAYQGSLILACNAVLLNFFYLASYALDGYAHAVESLSGRLLGSGKIKALQTMLKSAFKLSLYASLLIFILFLLGGSSLIDLLTALPEVRTTAKQHLLWLVILPLIAMPSFVYDGLCVGTTQSKVMRNAMLMAIMLGFLPVWHLFKAFFPDHPQLNHALWFSFLCFFAVRGIAMAALVKTNPPTH